jgi:hypothetical protein
VERITKRNGARRGAVRMLWERASRLFWFICPLGCGELLRAKMRQEVRCKPLYLKH